MSYNRVTFDRLQGGGRVYTVDVLNTKTTFQVDRRFSLRAIVQYESSRSRILTDFLASWELRPGTVRILYAFDPWRSSILLVAGDKAGRWNAWYREAIPMAEQQYEVYLKERAQEGGQA